MGKTFKILIAAIVVAAVVPAHGALVANWRLDESVGATTAVCDHVRPLSRLRRSTMSMSPVSLREFRRPSQKASSVPLRV